MGWSTHYPVRWRSSFLPACFQLKKPPECPWSAFFLFSHFIHLRQMPEVKPVRRETTRQSDSPGRPRSACQYFPQSFASRSEKRSKYTTPAWSKRRIVSRVVEPLRAKNGGRTQIAGRSPFPGWLTPSNRSSEQADQAFILGVSSRRWVRRVSLSCVSPSNDRPSAECHRPGSERGEDGRHSQCWRDDGPGRE